MKITYLTLNGHKSTAYVADEPDERGWHYGDNKHTDLPLAVISIEYVPGEWTWVEVIDEALQEKYEAAKRLQEQL